MSNHVVGLKAQRVRQIGTGLTCALFAHSRKISIDDERFRYLGRLSISPAISISNLGMTVTFYIARYDFRYICFILRCETGAYPCPISSLGRNPIYFAIPVHSGPGIDRY